jgi:hypothetical protein
MEESLHLSKITVVSTWIRMVLTQIASWVYKDSLTLTYIPTKYQSLIGIYYKFDTLIDVDCRYLAFTYIPHQH